MSEHKLPLAVRHKLHAVGVTARQKAREPIYRMKIRGVFYPWRRWLEVVEKRRLLKLKESQ